MRNTGFGLPRIHLLGTSVNKGKIRAGAAKGSGPVFTAPRRRTSLALSVPFAPRGRLTSLYGVVTPCSLRNARTGSVSRRRVTLVDLHQLSPVIVMLAMVGTLFG